MATMMRETRGREARNAPAIQLRKRGLEFVVEVVVGLLRACPAEETKSTPAGYGNGGAKTRNDELNCGSENSSMWHSSPFRKHVCWDLSISRDEADIDDDCST